MPRFRNTLTGVVVSVDDATAARLGARYESIDRKPATKRRVKKAATSRSDD